MGRAKRWPDLGLWRWVLAAAGRKAPLGEALASWREKVRIASRAGRQLSEREVSAVCLPFAAANAMDDMRKGTTGPERRMRLAAGLLRDADDHLSATDRTLCLAVIAAGLPGGGGSLPADDGFAVPQQSLEGPTR